MLWPKQELYFRKIKWVLYTICLSAWMSCHKMQKIPGNFSVSGTKRLHSSLLYYLLQSSYRQLYHFSGIVFCRSFARIWRCGTHPGTVQQDSSLSLINIRLLLFLIMAITVPIETSCWLWRTGFCFPQVLILEASGDYVNMWAGNKQMDHIDYLLEA